MCSVSKLQGKSGSRCDCGVIAAALATATTAFVIGAALYYRLFVTAASTREEIAQVAFFYGVTGMLVGILICYLVNILGKRELSTAEQRRLLREARTTLRTADPGSAEYQKALVTLGQVPACEDAETTVS